MTNDTTRPPHILDAMEEMRAWLARGNWLYMEENGNWVYISPEDDPPPDGVLQDGDSWTQEKPKS